MAKLSSYELLSKVWSECTFDEILEFGLSNDHISSESIINAASEYSDPNKEYSDDELRDIIKTADLDLILYVLNEKYTIGEVVGRYDDDDILNCFDPDTLIDFCEYELSAKYEEERQIGFEEGYDAATKIFEDEEKHILRDSNTIDKWCYLCDELEVSYYDENLLKEKLNKLFNDFNKDKIIYKKTKNIWQIK